MQADINLTINSTAEIHYHDTIACDYREYKSYNFLNCLAIKAIFKIIPYCTSTHWFTYIIIVTVTSSWQREGSQGSQAVVPSSLKASQSSHQMEYVYTHQGSACMMDTEYMISHEMSGTNWHIHIIHRHICIHTLSLLLPVRLFLQQCGIAEIVGLNYGWVQRREIQCGNRYIIIPGKWNKSIFMCYSVTSTWKPASSVCGLGVFWLHFTSFATPLPLSVHIKLIKGISRGLTVYK